MTCTKSTESKHRGSRQSSNTGYTFYLATIKSKAGIHCLLDMVGEMVTPSIFCS